MPRYILTHRVHKTLIGRGYELVCKTCGISFKVAKCSHCGSGDVKFKDEEKEYYLCKNCGFSDLACTLDGCVESKPSKYRRRKFYHCRCYDGLFKDFPDGDEDAESNESE